MTKARKKGLEFGKNNRAIKERRGTFKKGGASNEKIGKSISYYFCRFDRSAALFVGVAAQRKDDTRADE